MKLLIVLNPVAGGREKNIFVDFMKRQFHRYSIDYWLYETTGKKDLKSIKEIIKDYKPDQLLSVGGDGTSSICAKSLIDKDIPLGIIPFGSANGMAMELGINDDPEEAFYDFLISKHLKKLDLYKVNDKYYGMHIGDIGINARIVAGFTQANERGLFSYAKHFLREFSQKEMIEFTVKADDQEFDTEAYMVAFANARKYGTGVILNWKGNPFDGKIEIVLAKEMRIKTLLLAGMTTIDDEMAKDAPSEIISCKTAEIKSKIPVEVQVDGEFIGKLDKVKIEVIPKAVTLVLVNHE